MIIIIIIIIISVLIHKWEMRKCLKETDSGVY